MHTVSFLHLSLTQAFTAFTRHTHIENRNIEKKVIYNSDLWIYLPFKCDLDICKINHYLYMRFLENLLTMCNQINSI